MIGRQVGGLYYFKSFEKKAHSQFTTTASFQKLSSKFCNSSKASLWHKRLGHVPFGKLKQIDSIKSQIVFFCTVFPCSVCPQDKQARLSFPKIESKTKNCFRSITAYGCLRAISYTYISRRKVFSHYSG